MKALAAKRKNPARKMVSPVICIKRMWYF